MKRFGFEFGLPAMLAALASLGCVSVCSHAQQSRVSRGFFRGGSISGTVMDASGTPQMGALVQLLLPDASLVASALTDANGHYRLTDLKPGNYRVRVSAALFLPAVRQKLQVGSGSRAVVNMTLSTLLASGGWLPAARSTSSEADDDWMWTLRSSAMRPVLRLADEDSADPVSVSSSAEDKKSVQSKGSVTVQDSEGGFARGGTHNVLTLERRTGDGAVSFVRADFSGPRNPYPVSPSAEVSVGWERKMALGAVSRSVLTYTSHPEVLGHESADGMQTLVLRNVQRMELGDSIRVDAGSVIREFNLAGNAIAMEPFLKVAVQPSNGVVIAYTFSASRGTESLEDLDKIQTRVPMATYRNGHLRLERDRHEAVSLSSKVPHGGRMEVAVYRDNIQNALIGGTGAISSADMVDSDAVSMLTDPTTQSFVVSGQNYDATGVHVLWEQPVTNSFSLSGEFAEGGSLVSEAENGAMLAALVQGMHAKNTIAATVSADGKFLRTGTRMRVGYRWQPVGTLTAVDSFHAAGDGAYLHCRIKQSLGSIPMLPAGLEAVLDVQNLLAEGYQPFLSSDGRTLYLAQSPRVLQAGLSFNF